MRRFSFCLSVIALFALVALLSTGLPESLLHPPTAHAAPADGIIDGAQHPELIPDERALHMVLLTASWTDRSTDIAKRRARAVLSSQPLDDEDRSKLGTIAQQYRHLLEQLEDEQHAMPTNGSRRQDQARIYQRKQELLANTNITLRQQVTSKGSAQIAAWTQRAQEHNETLSIAEYAFRCSRPGRLQRLIENLLTPTSICSNELHGFRVHDYYDRQQCRSDFHYGSYRRNVGVRLPSV